MIDKDFAAFWALEVQQKHDPVPAKDKNLERGSIHVSFCEVR